MPDKTVTTIGWAGFSDGKIYHEQIETAKGIALCMAIFKTKKLAAELYEDVRKVEIKVIE